MRRERREAEFTEFFLLHGPGLRRTASFVVRDWHLAEDLTQQALVKLYAAWPRTRPETRLAYARRIVVNECLSHLRRHRPETPTGELPEPAGTDVAPVLDFAAALALLPPRQRAVVGLRYVDDLTITETGRVLGLADGTVKSLTAKAMATLRHRAPEFCPGLAIGEDGR